MPDFDKHQQERAQQLDAQTRLWADIENACIDHAVELEASLREYLARNQPSISTNRTANAVRLSRGDGLDLLISTQDHRTYEVNRPGANDPRDEHRARFLTRFDERRMMDEILEWVAKK
jgi:hypothetical protein